MYGSIGQRNKGNVQGRQASWIRFALPAWLVFVVVCVLFGFWYHDLKVLIWLMLATVCGVCILVICLNWYHQGFSPKRTTAILCLLGACTAALVGWIANDCCFERYWSSRDMETHVGVSPTAVAAGYADTGEITFSDEAHVASSYALGHKDEKTYCVAPVQDGTLSTQPEVQFWAAGIDCCSPGLFTCDDAWDPKAKSGVVMRNVSTLFPDWYPEYWEAVKQAEAAFGIASSAEPIFVRWVVNPEQVSNKYLHIGIGILIAACAVALLFCVAQGCVLQQMSTRQM